MRKRKPARKTMPGTGAIPSDKVVSLKELITALRKPSPDGYNAARATMQKLLDRKAKERPTAVDNAQFILSVALSTKTLAGYATLDEDHIDDIKKMLGEIRKYAKDHSEKRPKNFLMLAAPGAGKSHFIDCIAASLNEYKVEAVTFNMTALEKNEDMIPALDKVRNLKVQDKMPILFLDEFDTNPDNISLLLPLLWEGKLTLGQRELKLGRVVIVLAGSNPILPRIMQEARSMRPELTLQDDENPKIVDLLSRINGGVVQIPQFEQTKPHRLIDKGFITLELLRNHFGGTLRTVPLGLLHFVVKTEFRYGVRSIDHLVRSIGHHGEVVHLSVSQLSSLPFSTLDTLRENSLAYHVVSDNPQEIVEAWRNCKNREERILVNMSKDAVCPRFLDEDPGRPTLEMFVQMVGKVVTAETAESFGILGRFLAG